MLLSHLVASLALVPSLLAAGAPQADSHDAQARAKRYNPWVPPNMDELVATPAGVDIKQLESRANLEAAGRSNMFWAGQGLEDFPIARGGSDKIKLQGKQVQKRGGGSGIHGPRPTQAPRAQGFGARNKMVRRGMTSDGKERKVRLVAKRQQANAQCVVTTTSTTSTTAAPSTTAPVNSTSVVTNSTTAIVNATSTSLVPSATSLVVNSTSSTALNATTSAGSSSVTSLTINATITSGSSAYANATSSTSCASSSSASGTATLPPVSSSSAASLSLASSTPAASSAPISSVASLSPSIASTLAGSSLPASSIPASSLPASSAPASSTPASSAPATSTPASSVPSTTSTLTASSAAASSTTTTTSSSAAPSPSVPAWSSGDPSGTNGPFSGWGTWFDVGLGACGWWNNPGDPIVAISQQLYNSWPGATANPNNNPICSRHLEVCYGTVCTLAQVADMCPGCAPRSLDMSRGLFEHFASPDVGLFADGYTQNITWNWVPGSGPLPQLPVS